MKFKIELSWSKLMALIFQVLAFTLDWKYKTNGTIFMFSLPFSVFLITGKQYIDSKNLKNEKTNN